MIPLRHQLSPVSATSRPRLAGATRVLVVEDEKSLRDIVIRALGDWGFSATAAWSGEEAVRLHDADPADIAVIDLCLPGMNGIETLRRLKHRAPQLQGIILTGSATVEAAKNAIHLGIVEFLTKPCNRGELERAVDRARQRLPQTLPVRLRQSSPKTSVTLDEVERKHVLAALSRNNGDRSATARELGISRKTLYNKLTSYQSQGVE